MRRFLEIYARVGGAPFARATLSADVDAEVERVARAEGVVRAAPLARTFACGGGESGCAREVRGFDDDDDLGFDERRPARIEPENARTFVAVCTRSPHVCDFVEVTAGDSAQVMISRDALARAIVRALKIEKVAGVPAAHAARDDEPLLLGEETRDGERRNVWLVASPRGDVIAHLLAARERDARPALFLVPTALAIDPALFARHGAAAHVELARLDDLLEVRDGAIVARTRLRVVGTAREKAAVVESVPRADAASEARASATAAPRVVIDGVKVDHQSAMTINGEPRTMMDSVFLVILKLIAAHLRRPNSWSTTRELGFAGNRATTNLIGKVFEGLVPEGFRVLLGDKRGSFRLNPNVVIERVEWAVLEVHPSAGVQKVAREMRGRK